MYKLNRVLCPYFNLCLLGPWLRVLLLLLDLLDALPLDDRGGGGGGIADLDALKGERNISIRTVAKLRSNENCMSTTSRAKRKKQSCKIGFHLKLHALHSQHASFKIRDCKH